ncbi:unnamed protein product [Acanthoscelides obtectus]|uniref:Uncharacterized protein n=1 Tax=Acanthoscelides obtectus TaxID=200917 RepID=A0A9P0NSL8_ACAOB|nr:unnamed protein product [Acanthoscelides obtectus]CAK1642768.1 hypothetical protein AOBTE_LOCUS13203 [Acanthoscelides obtectus]
MIQIMIQLIKNDLLSNSSNNNTYHEFYFEKI